LNIKARLAAVFGTFWAYLQSAVGWIDRGWVWLATPFGVLVTKPQWRYPILVGVFALLCGLGALPVPVLPLVALGIGYVGVLAINRAWVANEKKRAAIAKKLDHGNPDDLPDLRGTALVAALFLFLLFPLIFWQLHHQFGLFEVHEDATLWSWFWFAIDKTYLKALPDWTTLYGVHITSIEVPRGWGRHVVFVSRLTFDYLLIQGLLRLWAIRTSIREAVTAVKTDPDLAVRVGSRAIVPLIRKLQDSDPKVRGAAANALVQLGDARAIDRMTKALRS
jgi:hypothetical protein